MRQPSDTACDLHPHSSHRLAIESRALLEALKRFISAKGGVSDASSDGFVDRAIYQHDRAFEGLVVLKGQFPRGEVVYVTAPGLCFNAKNRPSLDALVARIALSHTAELVDKVALQAHAVDGDGAPRRIQVRPGRQGRTEHRRRLKEERRLRQIRREWFGRDSWEPGR
ncbi:hypothetical protein [Methylopila sp. Yamaguchi]|uniref:hypothetical protein n=1 Tax=Methylopila sp. Yamaguchi TaxID=1437817 RepID=UPI000CB82BB9|nr:hypothetical protein [Methylopila sp. Yamaguchi]GBD46855.1 hypothetical protein METY_0068 [Methylopila sp. Yamaguchi]